MYPIPLDPPVTSTFFPATENSDMVCSDESTFARESNEWLTDPRFDA
jgi:hypothetical protein